MKKRSVIDLLIVIAVLLYVLIFLRSVFNLSIPVAEYTASAEYLWYYLPHKEGVQPEPMEKASYLKEYIRNHDVYYAGPPDEKSIYITFDDCPYNDNIPRIIDILESRGATAAFFMTEKYIKENPDVIKRIVAAGCMVCNHTAHHILAARLSYDKLKQELKGVEDAYREATGLELPKYFRPPQGAFTNSSLEYTKSLGYKTVFWSFEYVDWQTCRQPSAEKALSMIMKETHPGEIVLLHCQSKTNVNILCALLDAWKEKGYDIKSLDSLPNA